MIGLVDGLGDVGGTDAVAYLANERGTAAEGIHVGTVGALAQGADDRLALHAQMEGTCQMRVLVIVHWMQFLGYKDTNNKVKRA